MNSTQPLKIALVGNANIGKTTLFNKLCGLNQRTGNYPGVTIDKKKGYIKNSTREIELIDLPGINSLYPNSKDEELVVQYLQQVASADYPDKIVVVVSALNLKRNLYLFDQVKDLGVPLILAINMVDLAKKRGVFVAVEKLAEELGVPVLPISAKRGTGLDALVKTIEQTTQTPPENFHFIQDEEIPVLQEFADTIKTESLYVAFLNLTQKPRGVFEEERTTFIEKHSINTRQWKTNASILRYKYIKSFLDKVLTIDKSKAVDLTSKLDRVLLHPVFGYLIFGTILFVVFQAIFWLAAYPMDWIDYGFTRLAELASNNMPAGYFSRLIAEGIIPGLGGVLIFIPQITILFLLFSLLEESGYMTRIVYLTDRLMQKFGMSGKSIVPMISGLACAVPAIMATRTIENKRERLITILVTPLLTCSARIPVYVVLIALIIPDDSQVWIFNAQGLVLMALYIVGVMMTFLVAMVLKLLMKPTYKSFLLIDMPEYLAPDLKNVLLRVWVNVKAFVWDAGRIILATAVILFVLATNGGEKFNNAERYFLSKYEGTEQIAEKQFANSKSIHLNTLELNTRRGSTVISSRINQLAALPVTQLNNKIEAYRIEHSYLGSIGKTIEPVIQPLGYDWKIGIALVSSLAAREVFVGTISIIYAINSDQELTIRDRLRNEVNSTTGKLAFGFATCISLLLFYAFSLQCMSTVAITFRETKSIKWTALQFLYMGVLAYLSAFAAYQLLS